MMGCVAQYLSDGMLVDFGYPVAHEDDAQRAVWTGLSILESMDSLNTQLALSSEERIAVRLLGEIAAWGDPLERTHAEIHYLQALALAEKLGMRPLTAHCQLGLGTLYNQMEQPVKACAALSTAIALYRAMDMMFWLPQAEATLAQVGAALKSHEPG
jgi:hypothetical protein